MTDDARRLMTRRRVVVVVVMIFLIVGIVAGLGVRNAVLASRDLEAARAGLQALETADVDIETALPAVDDAQQHVAEARERLSGPSVTFLRWVPVVGRSIDAERAVTRAAGSSLAGIRAVVDAAPDLRTEGGVDVEELSSLADRLDPLATQARADLVDLRLLRLDWTPGRVRAAVGKVDAALSPLIDGLEQAPAGIELALGLLGAQGDRQVLVALGNNAELRGTGGFVSTFATGTVQAGTLMLDPFRDVREVSDPPSATRKVPAPAEYVEDFGPFLADTTLWLEWNMSPDVPDAASVAANVAGELTGVTPDLVLVLDVPALARIIGLTGQEVRLADGSIVAGDELTDALLVDMYSTAGRGLQEQTARRSELRQAAGDAAATLLDAGASPLSLVRELGRLARGRHLAIWSANNAEQAELERLGLAGSADPVGDDLALISVNNLNANKLDYYVERSVDVEATVGLNHVDVVQRVRLHNQAPDELVPYVEGTGRPGTVIERLEFSLSPEAELTSFVRDGAPAGADLRTGIERARLHAIFELPRGASTEFELRYTVPVRDGRYRLRMLPQPLAEDAQLSVTVSPAPGLSMQLVDDPDAQGPVTSSEPWLQSRLIDVVVR